ncbi:MAG TPA: ABC transporter permease [Acidimicrobiales bacterium]|nr:ABC transporter permease [Acidimicrobiales bacterium]
MTDVTGGQGKSMTLRAARAPVAWALGLVATWAVLAHLLTKGLPLGVVLLGVVYGSLYALIAIGIVLVYRGSRIINFAQAEFGVLAAVVAIELAVTYHVNWFLAMAVGIVGSLVLGAVIQGVVIRRFRKSSRLILTVATIGLAQLLTGVSALLPLEFCNPAKNPSCITAAGTQSFNTPLHVAFSVYPVIFSGNDVVAIGGAAVLIAGLALFMRYSRYGVAIRASAENRDRATLLGVPVPRLDTVVWSLAALLSAMAVLLRVPVLGFTGFQSVSGGGNDILLRTLAAAVIGRMDSLPLTAAAAVGIGVYESLATWTFANTVFVDATLVVIVIVALVLQRDRYARVSESDGSTWRSVAEVRPIPQALLALREVRAALWAGRGVLLAGALILPFLVPSNDTYLFAAILIYCIVGLSLLVLTGWTGQISLGQFGLAGIGGATTAALFAQHGWNFAVALVAGVVVGALAALVIGLPALRISGPFLAVTTLAFGISVSSYLLSPQYLSWFVTSQVNRPTIFGRSWLAGDRGIYFFCLGCFVAAVMAVRSLRRSRTGRSLIATRDNEAAARAVGLSTTRMKLTAFVVSGGLAGLAGAVFVIHQKGVNQGSFSADINIALFSMVVIGGLGSLPGVVLGAVYVWSTQYFLTGGWAFIASGGGILILLMFLPEGLGGLLYMLRDRALRVVAARHRLDVPGLAPRPAEDTGADQGAVTVIEEVAVGGVVAG